MKREDFIDAEWFASHPERRAVEKRNYDCFRRDGYSVDESLEAARVIEIEKWIEEKSKAHNARE